MRSCSASQTSGDVKNRPGSVIAPPVPSSSAFTNWRMSFLSRRLDDQQRVFPALGRGEALFAVPGVLARRLLLTSARIYPGGPRAVRPTDGAHVHGNGAAVGQVDQEPLAVRMARRQVQ